MVSDKNGRYNNLTL